MTAVDWNLSADPFALLDHLFPMHGTGSTPEQPRKLRLYFCALARVAWKNLPGPLRATLEIAERAADVPAVSLSAHAMSVFRIAREFHGFSGNADDLEHWDRQLRDLGVSAPGPARRPRFTAEQWGQFVVLVGLPLDPMTPNFRWVQKSLHRADLVRDIFENPYAPVSFDPAWRSASAVELARGMYRDRNFSHMPALGDLLEEAGCNQPGTLQHCRNLSGVHTRGCWVVDRLIARDADALASLSDPAG